MIRTVRHLHDNTPAQPQDRLTVLHTLRASSRGGSTYSDLVLAAPPPGCRQLLFTWRRALLGSYDVVHAHWPDQLVRDSRRPWLQFTRRRMLDLLLLRLRLLGTPLVWTAHNPQPHEAGGAAEQRSLRRFARAVDTTVLLSPAHVSPERGDQSVIPHSHYRDHFARTASPDAHLTPRTAGRLLYFGIIRRYKGVDTLLSSFRALAAPGATLHVVGQPHAGEDGPVLRACAEDPRIHAILRYVADEELVREVLQAQVVVLPYRGAMHNSGTVLAALSLGRPVLVPRSPTNSELSRTTGPGWVLEYDGELTTSVLEDALLGSAQPPDAPPDLSAHSPVVVAAAHRDAYDRTRARVARSTTQGRTGREAANA